MDPTLQVKTTSIADSNMSNDSNHITNVSCQMKEKLHLQSQDLSDSIQSKNEATSKTSPINGCISDGLSCPKSLDSASINGLAKHALEKLRQCDCVSWENCDRSNIFCYKTDKLHENQIFPNENSQNTFVEECAQKCQSTFNQNFVCGVHSKPVFGLSCQTKGEIDTAVSTCGNEIIGKEQEVKNKTVVNFSLKGKLQESLVTKGCECTSITYFGYESEEQMPEIIQLIQKDLSEPYSVYTYRYFIHNWPKLCFLAMDGKKCVGAIVCKLDVHKKLIRRGYIAMLAVDENYRKRRIGSNLVLKAIRAMVADEADEVVLETEITNKPALRLYENLGFVCDKRLFRYYLNGVDALRLKLWLR
ncbi:N-alpha-acetyltransferase 30-like isoform X2 [Limulus polyphemus]|nr:N-alpha-acetyltransferase 30-like isoform X2 [Limulus polyphemus]XP_013789911.1 N-alpha-acetyltransferase 30-like isoform X2 [Limulus polyphemus]XP_013789912.1 N-alpha-acetyltransferase 30-like isoform X2 [Limulus polyphemus]XP_013789913.1 N-alpha-acetyltransferase 30-like isoform X2 [Limulus polyphemus]